MEALGIDSKLLLAQAVNFLLFFYIFKRFLYKPFLDYINKQAKDEEEKERLLHEIEERERSIADKEREILEDVRAQATKMMKEAEVEAAQKRQEIIKKNQGEAVEIKQRAESDLSKEKEKLYDEVKGHVIKTSQALTEKVLSDFLNEKRQKEVLSEVFKNIKKAKVYEN